MNAPEMSYVSVRLYRLRYTMSMGSQILEVEAPTEFDPKELKELALIFDNLLVKQDARAMKLLKAASVDPDDDGTDPFQTTPDSGIEVGRP